MIRCLAGVSIAVLSATGVAQAQTAPGQLEELVVTARRTEEKLTDVPIAVSAFTAESITKLGITDATKLSNYTPGFEFTDYTNGRNGRGSLRYILMRGLYVANNNLLSSAALVFQDGAPVLSGEVLINDGIERVEVLKGPQNVYFGRSTFAGAVNYVTRNPGQELKASTSVEAGRFDYYKVDGHVEGPLIADKLSFGLDGQLAHKGGQYASYYDPGYKYGRRDTKSIAATLYATPTENLSIKLFANYYEYKDGLGMSVTTPISWAATCNPGGTLGRVGGNINGALTGNFYPCGVGRIVPENLIGGIVNYDKTAADALEIAPGNYGGTLVDCGHLFGLCTRNYTVHGIVNYELPNGMTFNTIAAWHKRPVGDKADSILQDVRNRPNPLYVAGTTTPRLFTSQYNIMSLTEDASLEGRFSSGQDQRLRWTTGANYVWAQNYQQLFFYGNTGAPPAAASNYKNARTVAKTVGLFGGVYYEPLDGLILGAEVRYQEDTLQSFTTTQVKFQKKYFATTPRFSVTYKLTPTLNIYSSYAQGVRPGGFNAGLVTYPAYILAAIAAQVGSAPLAYDQEKIWQAELGVKGTFFDNRVSANVSVYTGKLTQLQQSSTATLAAPDPQYGGRFDLIANSGSVKLKGVEADARWAVNKILTLSATFAYTDTSISGSNCFVCYTITGSTSIDGNRLQATPLYAGSLGADLGSSLTESLDWFVHGDVVYKGNRWGDQVNLTGTGASTLVNATIGIQASDWSVSLFGTNILNDKHFAAVQVTTDPLSGSGTTLRGGLPDRPMYGVRLKHDF